MSTHKVMTELYCIRDTNKEMFTFYLSFPFEIGRENKLHTLPLNLIPRLISWINDQNFKLFQRNCICKRVTVLYCFEIIPTPFSDVPSRIAV